MKTTQLFKLSALTMAVGFLFSGTALAAETASQDVTYEVTEINEIALGTAPSAMTINSATAGSEPTAATGSSSYDITTNGTGKKITAVLDLAMATDVILSVNATAPSVGASAGKTTLSTTAADVVTAIEKVTGNDLSLAYEVYAPVSAGVVGSSTRFQPMLQRQLVKSISSYRF